MLFISTAILTYFTVRKEMWVLQGTRLTTLKSSEGQIQLFFSGDDLVQLRNDRLDARG